ncbi:MAG: hypothetical protein WAO35_06165 [Terriglobia bacterium]
MKKTFATWKWGLGVVARSYLTVVVLAALIALWAWAAYAWLGLPESSVLLLMLALIWAIAQLLVAVVVVEGIVSRAADASATEGRSLLLRSLWAADRKKLLNTMIFCLVSFALAWVCGAVFSWFNAHSIEVASFLTFHSERAVSHVPIEEIFRFIEGLLWIVLSGFLLGFFIALLRGGWRAAGKQTGKRLAECAFGASFLTSLLSVAVFGGLAYELANWHPMVPPGFWDYTQMIVRFSLVLIIISAGALFWPLSLARLQAAKQNPQQEGHRGPTGV